jgi:hypothetical protein
MAGTDDEHVELAFQLTAYARRVHRRKLYPDVVKNERVLPSRTAREHHSSLSQESRMPLDIPVNAPTLFIRKAAFDTSALTRAGFDERLNLMPDEFRVEGSLIAIGPLPGDEVVSDLIDELEEAGLTYFDDFFELSGNWPEWLHLYAMSTG